MSKLPNQKSLSIQEASAYLGVSTKTLRRWEDAGSLVPQRTQGGHRRYEYSDLVSFKRAKSRAKNRVVARHTPVAPSYTPIVPSYVEEQIQQAPVFVAPEPIIPTPVVEEVFIPEPVAPTILPISAPVQTSPSHAQNVQVSDSIPQSVVHAIYETIEDNDEEESPVKIAHSGAFKKVGRYSAVAGMLSLGIYLVVSSFSNLSTGMIQSAMQNIANLRTEFTANEQQNFAENKVADKNVLAIQDDIVNPTFVVNVEALFNGGVRFGETASVQGVAAFADIIAANGGEITSDQTTFNLIDTTVTTVNFAGDATTIAIGAETGTTTINNSLAVDDNLTVAGDSVEIGTGTAGSVDLAGGDLYVTGDLEVDGTSYIPTLSINGESFTDLTGTGLENSSGTLTATLGTAITSGEIDDDAIAEVDLNVSNTATNGYALTYNSSTGGFTWTDMSSSSVFTDGGTVSYLTTTTDAVTIGSSTELAKLGVDGDTDEVQLLVQANSSQTANLFVIENSSGTDLFAINASGQLISGSSAITLTTTDGYLDGDAIQLLSSGTGSTSSASGFQVTSDRIGLLQGCANGEILKWNDGLSQWECATDSGGSSAIINVQNNDVAVGSSVDTVDFSTDFSLTASPSSEANIEIADDILDFTELQDTLDLDTTLTLNQGSNTWTQNFSGTTGIGLTYNAASLTTGSAFLLSATNTAITDTAINPVAFALTNDQATTANTSSYTGVGVTYNHNPSVATANETVGLFSIASNASSPTDTTIASILRLENLDTATGNSLTAADGLLIQSATGNLITDAIDVSDADLNNAINFGANFALFDGIRIFEGTTGTLTIEDTSGNDLVTIVDVGSAGNITVTGTSTLSGNVDATAGLDVTGSSLTVGGANFSVAPGTGSITTAGDLALNGGDLTSSSTLNITPGGAFVAGSTGQTTTLQGSTLSLTTTGAGNDVSITAADDIFFDDAQLTSAVPVSIADTALNASLTQGIVDAINDVYDAATGGAGGVWTRNSGSGIVYPTTSTDNVTVGGTSSLAKLGVDGDTDEIQVLIQGHSTQTNSLLVAETSAGADQLTLSNGGALAIEGALSDITDGTLEISDDLQVTGNDILDSASGTRITLGATTTLTNTTLSLSGTTTVSTDQTSLALFNATTTSIDFAGAATTLNIADSTTTKTIDIGGVTASGTDTINIATNSTASDTINIGNSNAATTVAITGGDDWTISAGGVLTLSASSAQTTAVVVTDTDYTNALSIGDNNITGTTYSLIGTDASIDFNDFDVSTDGILSFNSDSAGDQISVLSPAGDHQTLVVDAITNANTSTSGIIDLNIGAGDAAVTGIDIALTQNDGATAGRDAIAQRITLTANDADGDLFGLTVTGAASANAAAGSYEAAFTIDNAENTAAAMTDAILITSSGIANGITDAIDVSASNLNNAINFGANFALFDGIRVFEGSTGTLTFEDTAGNDLATLTDSGTTGTLSTNVLNLTANSNQIVLDSDGNAGTLTWSPTTTQTITFPDATGTVCLTTGNCAGSGTGVTTAGGSTNTLAKFTGSQAIGDSSITDTGSLVTFSTDVDVTLAATENLALTNSSATADLLSLSASGITTTGIDGISLAFTQADDADATDTNSAIAVALTSSSTDADSLYGLNFTDFTAGSATETAIHLGGGFDNLFEIEGTAGDGFQTFIQVTAASQDRTITIPDAAGEICLSSGNCAGGSGGSKWTDTGSTVYLSDTGDELVIGGSSPLSSSKVSIDGDADQIQLTVQGNGTQTTSLIVAEASTGADQLTLSNAGALAIEGALSDITDGTLEINDDLQVTGNDILDSSTTTRVSLGATTTLTNTTTTFSGTTTFTASSLANFTSAATLTFSGDIALSGGDITGANSATIDLGEATSGAITFSAGATGDYIFSIDDDSTIDATGTLTNTGSIADVNLTLGDDAGVDTIAGINIDATSAATGDADTLLGVHIANLASADATVTERALQIGSGWDANLFLNDTSASIQVADGGVITFEDPSGNDLMTITDSGSTGSVNITGDLTVGGTTVSSPTVNVFNCNDCIDWDDITDAMTLDADTTIAAGAGREITYNKTLTDATTENGMVINITASDSTSSTTQQFGLYINNVASTEGTDALLSLNNADADDSVEDAIRITSAAGTILTGIDFDDTDIVTDIELQNGETIDNNVDGTVAITATTLSFTGTTITASSVTALNCSDCVNFDDIADALTLDAATTITNATGSDLTIDLTSSGDFVIADASTPFFTFTDAGALTQAGSGQVTLSGNVDATGGLDVTTANLTVGGANFSVAPGTGNITTAGDIAVNGGDITASSTLNITPGGAFIAGSTGQTTTLQGSTLSLTSTGAGNDITLTAADDILLDDAQLTSAVPVSLADTALNASLTQGIVDAINDVYDMASGGSGGVWTLNTGLIYPTTSTDNVTIGGNSNLGKFSINGDTDEVQFLVQGHSSQGNNLIVAENSSGTDRLTLDDSGNLAIEGSLSDISDSILTINDDLQVNGNDIADSGGTSRITLGSTTTLTNSTFVLSGTSTLTASSLTALNCSDCIDFDDMEDTLDLDTSLTLNQGSNTWSQSYTGTTGTGYTLTANSLTTGVGLRYDSISSPTAGGLQSGVDFNITNSASTNPNVFYGFDLGVTDQSSIANSTYGLAAQLNSSGNAAKNLFAGYFRVVDTSTTANTIVSALASTQLSGVITSGTREVTGFSSTVANSVASTGGVTNVYGFHSNITSTVGAGGTTNGYGMYIANGTFNTTGTSTQYGLYVESVSGADTNYAAVFAGGNVGIGDTTPSAQLEVGNGTDSLQISTTGDLTFVDADGAASITGPAGGALTVAAGASQALTLTANNASSWTTSSGALTLTSAAAATWGTGAGDLTLDSGDEIVLADTDTLIIGGHAGNVAYNVISDSGGAPGSGSVASDDDLYIEGFVEIDGGLQVDATLTATDFSCTDCLDFAELVDSMTVDAATDINVGANLLSIDLDSTGTFEVRDGTTTFVAFDDDSTVDITFPAAGTLGIDAAATDNTTTGGVIDLNVDAGNAAVLGLNIDFSQSDGATAATDAIAQNITLTANDADGDVFGTLITSAATANAAAGSYESLLKLVNAENTAGAVTDAILIDSTSATDTDITDAIDASDTNIVNALNIGANYILGDGIRQFSSSSTVWTFEDTAGNDLVTITDNGTDGTLTISGDLAISGGNITSAVTADSTFTVTNTFTANGNSVIGNANTDTLTINAGTSGTGISFGDGSFANCTALETVGGVLTCGSDAGTTTPDFDEIYAQSVTNGNLTMEIDNATGLTYNMNTTGAFDIQDNGTTFFSFDDDSTIDITFPAAGTLGINAATTDNTTSGGVIDLNVDTVTTGNIGLNIDHIIRDSAGITAYGARINETIDTDAAQSSTGYGLYIAGANNDATSTLTALYVDAGTGAGTEYAAAFMNGNVGIGTASPAAGLDIIGSTTVAAIRNASGALGTGDAMEFSTSSDLPRVDFVVNGTYIGQFSSDTNSVVFKNNYFNSAANIDFQTKYDANFTTSRMMITQLGAVGIASTNPDARLEINHATGDNLRLTYNDSDGTASAYTDFSLDSAGDVTLDSAGGNIQLADADTIIIGGHAGDVAYNVISDSGGAPGSGSVASDDDLYVEGFVEIDGGLQVDATITASDFACTDCLDFAELENTLDIDEATDLNLGAFAFTIDMDSTGDFSIRDGVTDIATFSDTGAIAFAPTSGTNFSVTAAGAGAYSVTTATGAQTYTSSVVSGTTTTSGFVFDATALTTGTGMYLTSDSITTGTLFQIAPTGNTFTDGTLFDLSTTSTALTGSTSEGSLVDLDWTPGSTTNATGDLFRLSLGANGNLTGKIFDIEDSGSSIFSVGEAQITSAIPHQFTAAGDVSIAYDIQLTNQTASYIKSNAPLQVEAGETFESNNLTLKTYNSGRIIADTRNMGVGTSNGRGLFEVDSTQTATFGKALAIFNHDESQDLITASASGTTEFAIASDGTMYLGTNATTSTTTALCWASTTRNGATVYQVGDCNGTPTDLAENFGTSDTTIEAGDLVAITGQAQEAMPQGLITSKAYVKKTAGAYDETMIGVVSTQPNQTFGDDGLFEDTENPRPVSLAGRVPVKVTTQNGDIKAGDPLTASSIPGVAMKATREGYIIGRALQDYSNADTLAVGKVITFVNLAWYDPGMTVAEASQSADLTTRVEALENDVLAFNDYFTASDSGTILNVAKANLSELNVLGDVTLGDTLVNGKLQVGLLSFDNIENSINAVGTLKIQDLALGAIEFMGGLVTIDTNGDLIVNEITAQKYNVAGASAGTAVIPAGENFVTVETDQIHNDSLIFVTANTLTNQPLAVTTKVEGTHFIVEVPETANQDIEFNWWIVDHQE